jgi:predicted Fe-Mo cluster-binding NifX family protein
MLNMKMKIAVPLTIDNQIDDHFGHCEKFGVYTISEDDKITDVATIPSVEGCGCKSNIAVTLADNDVTVMLAGGIGNGAIYVLNNAGIDVVRGCSGDATENIMQYIIGNLHDSGSSCATHEAHHSGGGAHQCSH